MKINKLRPDFSRKEWVGLSVVIVLLVIEYFLCISILSGSINIGLINDLDFSGSMSVHGERWVNASIAYRHLMIPVYITSNYFMYIIFFIVLMTRDWVKIVEWESNVSILRLFSGFLFVSFIYIFVVFMLGETDLTNDINDLSRIIERQAFNDKYLIIMILFFNAICGYYAAEYSSILLVKLRKLFKYWR